MSLTVQTLARPSLLVCATHSLIGLLTAAAWPLAAAAELHGSATVRYDASNQVTSISKFADLRPSDWAYQALRQLIDRYGCLSGYSGGSFSGSQELSRHEAAALLNACLDQISNVSDELKRLLQEFEKELALLRGRVDGQEAKVAELEATRFSPTTTMTGLATFVLGANSFGGSASDLVRRSSSDFGATSFNYDLQLSFDTSFTGKDLLRTILRAGNFDIDSNTFFGAGPSSLSTLEVAFQEEAGADIAGIDRLYYQFPLGDFTISLGARVGQENMLALWPSVYPADTVLDVLTLAGAPAAYNKNLGAGAALWWQKDGFSISANYVAANAAEGDPDQGGIASAGAGGSGTVQIGYGKGNLGLAAIFSSIENANDLIVYATNFALDSFSNPGNTYAFGLSGYWQPERSGWLPSISAGWGFNNTNYASDVDDSGLVASSQSWSVGLQWQDVFSKGHVLGMAVGQPTFATRLHGGETPRDGNLAMEWWYKFQLTDNIAVTPALFYLNRPLGGNIPSGEGFNQLGALIKTSFSF